MQNDSSKREIRVAVVQAQPAAFRREEGIERACALITEAAENGAQLVLFPEAYIPAYPRGFSFGTLVGSRSRSGRELWQKYWDHAVEVPSPETARLGDAAREAGVELAIGVVERDTSYSRATLFCSLLHFGAGGELRNVHRKLKPTAAERLIWGEGDGSTLNVSETPLGRIGGLICWENLMPLARMAIYGQGVEIYLAPTADQRDGWQATLRHIAIEGRCFVLGAINTKHEKVCRRKCRPGKKSMTYRIPYHVEVQRSILPWAKFWRGRSTIQRGSCTPRWIVTS